MYIAQKQTPLSRERESSSPPSLSLTRIVFQFIRPSTYGAYNVTLKFTLILLFRKELCNPRSTQCQTHYPEPFSGVECRVKAALPATLPHLHFVQLFLSRFQDADSLSLLPSNLIILDLLLLPLPLPPLSPPPAATPAAFVTLRSILRAASRATSLGRPVPRC